MKNRIAQLRKERRITQEELADAVEVTRQTIISLGKRALQRLAAAGPQDRQIFRELH